MNHILSAASGFQRNQKFTQSGPALDTVTRGSMTVTASNPSTALNPWLASDTVWVTGEARVSTSSVTLPPPCAAEHPIPEPESPPVAFQTGPRHSASQTQGPPLSFPGLRAHWFLIQKGKWLFNNPFLQGRTVPLIKLTEAAGCRGACCPPALRPGCAPPSTQYPVDKGPSLCPSVPPVTKWQHVSWERVPFLICYLGKDVSICSRQEGRCKEREDRSSRAPQTHTTISNAPGGSDCTGHAALTLAGRPPVAPCGLLCRCLWPDAHIYFVQSFCFSTGLLGHQVGLAPAS